jgi:hypothetical protein
MAGGVDLPEARLCKNCSPRTYMKGYSDRVLDNYAASRSDFPHALAQ